jgi:predicted GH43/DUF377 family glycosyl hydrolase
MTGMSEFEKNWMPFEYNGELYFEYSIHPRIIIRCNTSTGECEKVYSQQFINPLKKHIGGGAPAQLVNVKNKKYFLSIAHTRENSPRTVRKNFFYLFNAEPPFNVIGMSDEFSVESDENNIEFASGIVVVNSEVIVSLGIQDCYSVLAYFDLNTVIERIHLL